MVSFTPWLLTPVIQWRGGCVDPIASVDSVTMRKISVPTWNLTPIDQP